MNLHERELAVDHDVTPGPFRGRNNFVRLRQRFDHWLLAKDMTTVLQCRQALPMMKERRSADGNHLGLRRPQHFVKIAKQ
jgi:hypothetical protein